jgi:hypothetical protein
MRRKAGSTNLSPFRSIFQSSNIVHQQRRSMKDILHWSQFGRRGEPSTTRATAGDWKTEPFHKTATSTWDQVIPRHDLSKILNGVIPGQMEDKWFVYSEGPDEQGNALLLLHRSWTGYKVAEVKLTVELDKDGNVAERDGQFVAVTWETDTDRYNGTEKDVKSTVVEVCNWCLGAKIPSKPVVQNEQDGDSKVEQTS